jgi:hypothetical protein
VEVVEIRSKPQPVNGPFDVFFDMSSRVGHSSLRAEDVESTFGRHCNDRSGAMMRVIAVRGLYVLTEEFVTDIVLLDEIPE